MEDSRSQRWGVWVRQTEKAPKLSVECVWETRRQPDFSGIKDVIWGKVQNRLVPCERI